MGTVLNRGAQADACGATHVLGRGGQAVAPGSCLLIVVPRPLPTAPFLVRRTYLIAVLRSLPAAPLAVLCASRVLGRGAQAGA
jgi:hypothetical protein